MNILIQTLLQSKVEMPVLAWQGDIRCKDSSFGHSEYTKIGEILL